MPEPRPRVSVLFVCTHNSARSHLAEAILRSRGGDRFEVGSAGSHPGGRVHPMALELIREMGGDPEEHRSKGFDEVLDRGWDVVVTVCDQAAESCPLFPARTVTGHWGVRDPSHVEDEAERRAAFRDAYERLARRVDLFLALDPAKLDRAALAERLEHIQEEADRRTP